MKPGTLAAAESIYDSLHDFNISNQVRPFANSISHIRVASASAVTTNAPQVQSNMTYQIDATDMSVSKDARQHRTKMTY